MVSINIWAVIVSAIVMWVIGAIWYGPLFGKQWTTLLGLTEDDKKKMKEKGMTLELILIFIGSLLMSYVLAASIVIAVHFRVPHIGGVGWGIHTAFWVWLGFVAPVTLGSVVFERKSWKLWLINNGYYLVALIIAGLIIGSWM